MRSQRARVGRPVLPPLLRLVRLAVPRGKPDGPQQTLRAREGHHADGHHNGREPKSQVPRVGLAHGDAEVAAEQRSHVDARIEQGEARVPARVALLVERAHHGGDIRLEEAGAHDVEGDAEEEELLRVDGEHQAADDHQRAAPEQRLAEPEDLVREQPAHEGEGVDEGLGRAVLQVRRVLRHHELVDHEEGQHAAHAVEAEALPHLGEEEPPELARVLCPRTSGCFRDRSRRERSRGPGRDRSWRECSRPPGYQQSRPEAYLGRSALASGGITLSARRISASPCSAARAGRPCASRRRPASGGERAPSPPSRRRAIGVPMPPSAMGATSTLSSSMRSAARKEPLIFPPPSRSSFLMPNSFRSFSSTLFRFSSVLPPNRYETPLAWRKAR